MAKRNALTWIISEAKNLKRKFPKRFKTWKQYVKQASAIYHSKQRSAKRSAPMKRKRVIVRKIKRVKRKRLSGSADQPELRHNAAGNKIGNVEKSIDKSALLHLHYLLKELYGAQHTYQILKRQQRDNKINPFNKKTFARYPGYIRSLKKQISEAKKNIK